MHEEELYYLYSLPNIIQDEMVGTYFTYGEQRNTHRVLVGKSRKT
jgi:hypothetical protein